MERRRQTDGERQTDTERESEGVRGERRKGNTILNDKRKSKNNNRIIFKGIYKKTMRREGK